MKTISVCVIALLFVCWANAASYHEECRGDCKGYPVKEERIIKKSALWGNVEKNIKFDSPVSGIIGDWNEENIIFTLLKNIKDKMHEEQWITNIFRIYFFVFFPQRLIRGIKHIDYKSHRVVFESYGLGTTTSHVNLKSQKGHGINSTISFYVQ